MDAWNIVLQGGAAGVLFVVLSLIMTGKLVPGWVHQDTVKRCDKLEQLSADNLSLAARMTTVMEQYQTIMRDRARDDERQREWQRDQDRTGRRGSP